MHLHTRREVLKCSAIYFPALANLLPVVVQNARGPNHNLNWDQFLDEVHAALKSLQIGSKPLERKYVSRVQRLLTKVQLPEALPFGSEQTAPIGFPSITSGYHDVTFEVKLLCFAPGDSIPAHNHPAMTGVAMCVSGAVRVEAFDIQEQTAGSLLLKRTSTEILSERQTANVTSKEQNIHRLRATERCDLLDVFTPPYDPERIQQTEWYDLSPADPDNTVFVADRWKR